MNIELHIKTRVRAGIALITMLLAGCATGPAYVRPDVNVPAKFKEQTAGAAAAPAAGWRPASPEDARDRGAWWEIYDDASLNQLEARVSVSNQSIVKAVAMLKEARAAVGAARSAYFPLIQAGIEPNRSLTSQTVLGRSLAGKTVWDNTAGVTASWEPDLFGKVGHAVESAKDRAEAGAADLASVQLSMHAELAVDYFDLRGLDTDTELLQQTVVAFQAALDIATQRFAAGVASDSDVALAQTQLQTTRSQLIDVGVMRAQLEHAIAAQHDSARAAGRSRGRALATAGAAPGCSGGGTPGGGLQCRRRRGHRHVLSRSDALPHRRSRIGRFCAMGERAQPLLGGRRPGDWHAL